MPAEIAWFAKHLTARAHGCDLAVLWRPDGRWGWMMTVAGERVADGIARSQDAAQDAAVRAARDHASKDGSIQLDMF